MKEEIGAGQMLYASDVYTETITRRKPTCCFSWITGGGTVKETVEEINYLQVRMAKSRYQ